MSDSVRPQRCQPPKLPVPGILKLRSTSLAGMSVSGQGHVVKWCYPSGLGLPSSRLI